MKVDEHGVTLDMGIGSNFVLGNTYYTITDKEGVRVHIHKDVIYHILFVLQRDMKKQHKKTRLNSLLDLLEDKSRRRNDDDEKDQVLK